MSRKQTGMLPLARESAGQLHSAGRNAARMGVNHAAQAAVLPAESRDPFIDLARRFLELHGIEPKA